VPYLQTIVFYMILHIYVKVNSTFLRLLSNLKDVLIIDSYQLNEFSPSQYYKYNYSICFVLFLIFSGPGKNHSLSSNTAPR
jgi:hypothetical protein